MPSGDGSHEAQEREKARTHELMWSGRDLFHLSPRDWLRYHAVLTWKRAIGAWRYPMVGASGDLETMRFIDVVYWFYKAQEPTTRAVKGSGLEELFSSQRERCRLPLGFVPATSLQLTAVGDLMDHPFLGRSQDALYEQVADQIFGADVSMANLECVVCPGASRELTYRNNEAPPLSYGTAQFEAATRYREQQYTFVATANNHSLDEGERGVSSTLDALSKAGIAYHGMNRTEDDATHATIIERNGIRLGVLSYTFGLNGKRPPPDKPWMVNRAQLNGRSSDLDVSTIQRQLDDCRAKAVDCVVAQLHWGMEHEYYPRPEQLDVAHRLAELGCDVIIGHHPHVVQPVEYYRTKRDPDRVVPIFYSLGNLVTPFSHPAFRRSGIANVRVVKGIASDGRTRTYIEEARVDDVVQEIDEGARQLRLVMS